MRLNCVAQADACPLELNSNHDMIFVTRHMNARRVYAMVALLLCQLLFQLRTHISRVQELKELPPWLALAVPMCPLIMTIVDEAVKFKVSSERGRGKDLSKAI